MKLLKQANEILLPDKKIEVVERKSVFATPTSMKHFLSRQCKLKFGPHGKKNKEGMSEAYFDGRENSACMKRMKLLTQPIPPGKWGILILESRGAGKSTGAECTSFGNIIDDPTSTHIYCAQVMGKSIQRVRWVSRHIKASYPGMFNKDDWSHEQFTVNGADPTSDDPTMQAAAPEKDIEGSHATNYWLDDLVSDKFNKTYQKRRQRITWFEEAQKQFTPGTEVRAIGTRHKLHNLWEEIIDNYSDEFEIFITGCYDEATGERFYPWMSDEFLASKEKHDEQGFKLSFQNIKVRVDDTVFEPNMFKYGDPPMIDNPMIPGGKQLHPRLFVYLLTDFAQSSRNTPGTSETALVVLAKDYDDTRYILDVDIGRYETDVAQIKFLDMYAKWRPHGLMMATVEDRGPGRSLYTTLPQLAKALPQYDFVPAIQLLARSSDEAKTARITMMYAPFARGKFCWSQHFLNPKMFKIDARGAPVGVAAQRLLNYADDGDEPKDFPDALADEGHISKDGPACPSPSPPKIKQKALTDREWSKRRALNKLRKPVIYI